MKLKTSLFVIFVLITSITGAQNLILAKAFYKKAQQEYSNKNYTKVFKLLNKTKEQLGGESNPEITYLEAKTHYNSDINVAKAKKLLTQFLEEADPNDSRVDEVSSLIVDIEVNDKIDEQGNFKSLVGRSGIKTFYYDTGEKEWVEEFKKGVKNGFIKRYNKTGILIQSGSQKNGYVNGFYEWFNGLSGKLYQTNYYDKNGKKTKEERQYNSKNGKLERIYTYLKGKKNGTYKYFFKGKLYIKGNYESDKLKGKYTQYYTSGSVQFTCTYNNTPYYDTKTSSFIEGIKTQYSYSGNGNKIYEQNYIKGKKQGLKTSFYSSGTKASEENYINDKKQGRQKYYYINGNIKRWEHLNTAGELYGERAYYYKSNGKMAINIAYENGRAIELLKQVDVNGSKLKISKLKKGNGYIKRINDAGVVVYQANIVNGYENGLVKEYQDNGMLMSVSSYHDGKKGIEKAYSLNDGRSIHSIYNRDTDKEILTNYGEFQYNSIIKNKSIEEVITFLKLKNPIGKDFYLSEIAINRAGYYYLKKNPKDALKIFKMNIEFYPEAWNTYDSYGECLIKLGRKEEAIKSYKKYLELNPKNESAIKALKKITK